MLDVVFGVGVAEARPFLAGGCSGVVFILPLRATFSSDANEWKLAGALAQQGWWFLFKETDLWLNPGSDFL